jgi:ATP-dependent Clp endopeptidase proteolytic subunit ClpP
MAIESAAPGYRMQAKKDRGEIYLYGPVGEDWFGMGVSAKVFADDLKKLGAVNSIDLRINSEGGDVFAGKAMYSLLKDHKAKVVVHIDGLAASAASFIAMAGDEIEIAEGAFVMIHDAYGGARGRAKDLRDYADLLDSVNASIVDTYVDRTKNDAATIKKWMDEETWMSGKDAVARGFADKLAASGKTKARASIANAAIYNNLPAELRPNRMKALAALGR